ncbi:hypothetical protein OF377_00110 [Ureaplasma sp. ES3154-GEN]|uniref:hypothetical protein n=1 Tax=Ureaplasma sp. ES3154-GEN TaxID=2984844 RepID=UPI0021E9797C|nr:hypothetical protein [Ureaplasma sp. ES3154-GEN]MCV3743291.1 hypothetical protein [Ureaplasma sp. ES3154-GEN]
MQNFIKYNTEDSLFKFVSYNNQTKMIDVIATSSDAFVTILNCAAKNPYLKRSTIKKAQQLYTLTLEQLAMEDYDAMQANQNQYTDVMQSALVDESLYLYHSIQKAIIIAMRRTASLEDFIPFVPYLAEISHIVDLDDQFYFGLKDVRTTNILIRNALQIYLKMTNQDHRVIQAERYAPHQAYIKSLSLKDDVWKRISTRRKS